MKTAPPPPSRTTMIPVNQLQSLCCKDAQLQECVSLKSKTAPGLLWFLVVEWCEGRNRTGSLSLTELTGSWLDCFYRPEAVYQGCTSPCHFLDLCQVHGGRQKTMRSSEKLIESPNKERLAFLKSKTMSCRLW